MGDQIEAEIEAATSELADLAVRRDAVELRLHALRRELARATGADSVEMAPALKVALFRSLFRGRDDVFAVRWQNRKGKAGYSPNCANEWEPGVCEKPRVRCASCANQAFRRDDDLAALDHLQGRQVMGIYPLLEDDTCWLLAIDLDGATWREDTVALRAVCVDLGLSPAVERSRSGAGAHLWFFFAEPVPTADARALGTALLTRAMERSSTLSMDSYDRLFPSQDTLPKGGFGNLIALPLQRAARDSGNTLFLDDRFEPHADQWAYLGSINRVPAERLRELVAGSGSNPLGVPESDSDAREPWRPAHSWRDRLAQTQLPETIHATLAQRLYVERDQLTPPLLDALRRLATFANPEFGERQGMRLSTALTPRVIRCFDDLPHHLALPRGCTEHLRTMLADIGVTLVLTDERSTGSEIKAVFTGELRAEQTEAVDDLFGHEIGVLSAPPGTGKTVMGANLIAQRGRSTLVLVHRRPLLEQWLARLDEFLDISDSGVGVIGGGRHEPTGCVDVAMVQSLARPDADPELLAAYGHVIVDECHHVPAVSIERVLAGCPARYVTGLTATPYRRDGHQPIIAMQCGPIRHTIDAAPDTSLALRVVKRDTGFDAATLPDDPAIQEIYSTLASDAERADLVAEDVRLLLEDGRAPLVLTERLEHLERLADRLRPHTETLVVLHGGVTPRRRRNALAELSELPPEAPRVVLATGRFIGEGFDDSRLDTLLLTMPIAWKGTVVQYAGRLHRPHPGKHEAWIYDYVDEAVPVLRRMFAKRSSSYRAMGYAIDETSRQVALPMT